MDGRANAVRGRHHDVAWLAWNVAALSRAKALPKLKTWLKPFAGPARKPAPRDWRAQKAAMMGWAQGEAAAAAAKRAKRRG